MNRFASDVRQALRSLRASPGLVATSVLSLGLGLGVNLTLFAAIGAVFFYEPTVADRDRVVAVQPGNSNQFSYLNYRDLRESAVFESVAGYRRVRLTLRTAAAPEGIDGIAVTPDFFEFLGIPPALGRHFTAAEAAPERQPRVAVLSHPFWQRRFGGDPELIGRELTINGEPFAVIGVLPEIRPVTMLQDPDVYVPISRLVLPTINDRNNGNALAVLGRLRPGMTSAQALAAVTALDRRLEQAHPADNADMGRPGKILPVRGGDMAGSSEQLIVPSVLIALFGLVLLSACANVAGLLLAKAAGREREIALRVALGASRAQIVRLLLTESFTLAALGTLAGALLSAWLTRTLNVTALPGAGPLNLALEPSASLAVYAVALLTLTGLLCGIAPALRPTKRNITAVMQSGESHGVTGRLRLRHAFVVGQVAVCLILLVLSSLLLRSLTRISEMDPGFDIERGLVATVHVDAERYAVDGGLPLGERLAERLQQLSGVESVSFANILALGTDRSGTRLRVEGGASNAAGPRTYVNSVSPRYFATLGIPLVRGRDFNASDRKGGAPVAIVTESFERAYFPGQSALGKRVRRSNEEPYFEIVGLVGDHMYGSYGDSVTPIFYSSYLQQPRVSTQVRPVVLHIRTSGPPSALVREVRNVIAAVDSTMLAEVQTLREATGSEAAMRRYGTQLLASAGGLGLLLATTGLYGMMAFVVATRTSEIGVRMALGATAAQILGSVLTQGMKLVGTGLAIGTVVSLLLAQAAVGLLAGLSPADPVAFGGTVAVLMFVGLAACLSPARRASRVDPLVALRRL
ncbi:MAG TPA: ABC transporter permease [Vicinamibacterales bacterium]|nr:ABC transporter permease [Vicinamibacterales bacterium]